MPLKNFSPEFKDFPDYILKITKNIWEDRDIASLHQYYTKDIIVRSPSSVVTGNDNVIAATMATLSEFPDRQLLGEDVIYSGDDDNGFLSSHRILTTATHHGDGVYGKATGKKLSYRVLADCAAKDNMIYDEWLIRDQKAIITQLGWDIESYVRGLIEKEGGYDKAIRPLTPHNDRQGDYQSTGNDNTYGQQFSDHLNQMMHANFSCIHKNYDRACHLEFPDAITAHGWDAADRFWLGLRASLPNATFSIDHTIGRDDDSYAPRAAIRWSLFGKHDGWGILGIPSHAEIYVLGISHVEFGPYGIRREYTLFDETAVLKQILLQKGA